MKNSRINKCDDFKEPFRGYLVKKKNLYYYKCRTTGCKCNKSVKQLHEFFEEELMKLTLKEENIKPLNMLWKMFIMNLAETVIMIKENLQKLIFSEGIYYDRKNEAFSL